MISHSRQTLFQPHLPETQKSTLVNFENYAVCVDVIHYYISMLREAAAKNDGLLNWVTLLLKILKKENAKEIFNWIRTDFHEEEEEFIKLHNSMMNYLLHDEPVDKYLVSYYMIQYCKIESRQLNEYGEQIDIISIFKSHYIKRLLASMVAGGFIDILDQVLNRHPEYVNCDLGEPGITLLHMAILSKHPEMVKTLVMHQVDVNKNRYEDIEGIILRDHEEYIPTPLSYALFITLDGNNEPNDYPLLKEIVKFLLDHGADPEKLGVMGSASRRCEINYDRASPIQKEVLDLVAESHKQSLKM